MKQKTTKSPPLYNEGQIRKFTFFKKLGFFALVIMISANLVNAQTTVFTDDFSANQSATYTTSGAIGASAWSISRSGSDYGGRRNTSPAQLELTNDVGGTANVNGWVLASTSSSSFTSPYNTTLSSNSNVVTWTFNMRQIRTDPSGFASGNYGVAYILAGTSTTNNNTGSGYAVALGQSGSTDAIRLVRYTSGISGTMTNIITSNTSGLTDFGLNYVSVKVTYTPSTNTWELFLRDDGASAFTDPTSGSLTSQGTAVDNTHTGTSLTIMGAFWNSATAASQTAFFDNIKVEVASSASTSSNIILNSGFTHPTNIDYTAYQAASTLTDINSIEVGRFDIQDGGGSSDADALSTTLSAISFTVANFGNIRTLALFDGSTNVGEITSVTATSSFSSLTLAAADNGSKTFSVRATFKNNSSVIDNQQISFTVSSATASGSGSSFASANAGAAATSITGDNNRIEVTATDLVFDVDPTTTQINVVMSPSPTIFAWDANLNIDLDFTGSVGLTTTGTFAGGATTSVNAVSGVATFSNLIFSATGTARTIEGSSVGLNATGNSSTFDITNPAPEINLVQNVTSIASGGSHNAGSVVSGNSGSAITFTIENLGNNNLTYSSITSTNTTDFTLDLTGTSSPIAPSGNTTFAVTFNPQSAGALSTVITVNNNDGDEGTYTFTINGTGTVSTASDVITTVGYTYSSNIDYTIYQTSSTLTTGNSIGVNGLTLRDGGATTDNDNLATTLTAITFSTGGSTAIKTAALFDGSTNISEVAVNGATSIAFSGLNLTTSSDGGTKVFELRVTYQNIVTDNQQITFTVSSATSATTQSAFASGNAGAAASTATSDINRLEVTATLLSFVQQPSNVPVYASMAPAPTVSANDANGSRDLDYVTNMSVTTTGTFSGGSTNTVTPIAGLGTFSNLKFSTVASARTIAVSSGALSASGNSNTFDINVGGVLLLEDNFNYSGLLTANSYTATSGTGTNNLTSGGSGLTFANYAPSSIGDALAVANTGQDVTRPFTLQNSPTTVYAAFLVNISAAQTGDYVFAFAPSAGTTTYRARTFIKASTNSGFVNFGISNTGAANYNNTPADYAINTTHLVVVKYTFTSATTATATIFINPNTSSEPGSGEVSFTDNTGGNAPADITSYSIRQGTASSAPTFVMDRIRIATDWNSLMSGPISELSGSATVCSGTNANLNVAVSYGTSPYTVVVSDGGSNTYTATSSSPVTIPVSAAGTYTIVSVTDANGNFGADNSGSSTVTVNTPTAIPTSVGTYSQTLLHADGESKIYGDASCNLIASIEDAVGGNTLGSTSLNSEIFSANLISANNGMNGQVYLRRNYTITPTSSGSATVTFYVTQADFDAYNASNGSLLDMPTSGNNADPNIANIELAKVTGGTLITGTFTYPTISVNWNNTDSRWEITTTTDAAGAYYFFTDPSCNTSISNLAVNSISPYSVTLGWTAAGAPATSYDVRYRALGASTWQPGGSTSSTSIVINGLTPNVQYESQVKARCSASASGLYSPSLTYTTDPADCGVPAVLNTITTTAVTANISWTAVTGASTYWVNYKPSSGSTWSTPSTSGTSMVLTGLSSNTQYDIRIMNSCTIGGGLSPFSATQQFTTQSSTCVTTPVTITTPITVSGSTATISWGAVSGVSLYYVFYKPSAGNTWSTPSTSSTSLVLTGLTPGTNYDVKVMNMCTGGGFSQFSTTEQFTTTANPCITTPVTITTPITVSGSTATISWGAVSGVSLYYVFYKPSAGSTWSTPSTSSTSLVLTGLTPGTNYDVKVMNRCTGGGFSQFSTTEQFTTTANPCITTPVTIVTPISATSTSATITWNVISGVSNYYVFYKPSLGSTWSTPSTSSTSMVLTGLTPGIGYDVKVMNMCTGGGFSQFSATENFNTGSAKTTNSLSASIYNFQGVTTSKGKELTWSTISESASKGFNVLHSADGQSYNTLATIASQSNNGESEETLNYAYTHTTPATGANYYRLEMIAIDGGQSLYNQVVRLDQSSIQHQVTVTPNPTRDIVKVTFMSSASQQTNIKVMDMTGRVVKVAQATTQEGINTLDVNLNELAAGMYTLHLFENNKLTHVSKIQKQD